MTAFTDSVLRLELFKNIVMNPYVHLSAANISKQKVVAVNAVKFDHAMVATKFNGQTRLSTGSSTTKCPQVAVK